MRASRGLKWENKMYKLKRSIVISFHWYHFQVTPSELSTPKNFTSFLTAQDSLFNRLIRNGDLNKATQLANTLLEAIAKDSPLSLAEKTKVM